MAFLHLPVENIHSYPCSLDSECLYLFGVHYCFSLPGICEEIRYDESMTKSKVLELAQVCSFLSPLSGMKSKQWKIISLLFSYILMERTDEGEIREDVLNMLERLEMSKEHFKALLDIFS